MNVRLDGKVAVVTGAGGGVGRAYARAFAAAGASVVVNDVGTSVDGSGGPQSLAESVVEEIRIAGGSAVANRDSVADFAAARRIIDCAIDSFGTIDILVANAGIMRPQSVHEASEQDWADVMAVHANGTFNCYRHAISHMIQKNSGTVITTGAAMAQGYFPGLAAYRAAKAAILSMTLHAAEELRDYNININSVTPGSIITRMQQTFLASVAARGIDPSGWPSGAAPETVPPLGLFLSSDKGRSITGRAFYLFPPRTVKAVTSYGALEALSASGDQWDDGELDSSLPGWLARLNDDGSYVSAHLRVHG